MKNEGKFFIFGHDKRHRPVLVIRPAMDNTSYYHRREKKSKHVVYLLEKARRRMDLTRGELEWSACVYIRHGVAEGGVVGGLC